MPKDDRAHADLTMSHASDKEADITALKNKICETLTYIPKNSIT